MFSWYHIPNGSLHGLKLRTRHCSLEVGLLVQLTVVGMDFHYLKFAIEHYSKAL
jgi:hypothetical protein